MAPAIAPPIQKNSSRARTPTPTPSATTDNLSKGVVYVNSEEAPVNEPGNGIAHANTPDPLWEELVGTALAAGKRMSEGELNKARGFWISYEDAEHFAIVRDFVAKIKNGTWSDAMHTPTLCNYLNTAGTQQWRATGPGRVLPEIRPPTRIDRAHAAATEAFKQREKGRFL